MTLLRLTEEGVRQLAEATVEADRARDAAISGLTEEEQDTLRGLYGKNTKYFSLDDYKTVLGKVPKHVRIDFSGMAEPWANPDATAMLRQRKNGCM